MEVAVERGLVWARLMAQKTLYDLHWHTILGQDASDMTAHSMEPEAFHPSRLAQEGEQLDSVLKG